MRYIIRISGPRCIGTYFGSGDVTQYIRHAKKYIISEGEILEDNGFFQSICTVWDLPVGTWTWEKSAYPPGYEEIGEFTIHEDGTVSGDLGPYTLEK